MLAVRLLLRAESVASSYIEGLVIGGRRLRAEAARSMGGTPGDFAAEQVLGNIDAMTWAVDTPVGGVAITVDVDRLLCRGMAKGRRGRP